MSAPQVGAVTERPGARLHYVVAGRANDNAGRGTILAGSARDLTADLVRLVCRRCRKHLRAAAEQALQAELAAPWNRYSPARVAVLTALADAFKTPAEVASDIDLAARINATIDAAANVQALPVNDRPRTWAELRADYAATHQPVLFAA